MNIDDLVKLLEVHDTALEIDPSAESMILSKSLSPSTLNAMNGCHARYAVEKLSNRLDEVTTSPLSPSELGKSAHSVLEELMQTDQRTPSAIEGILSQLIADGKVTFPTDDALFEEWETKVLKMANGIFDIENPSLIDVVGTETQISTELWGVPILGYIDRIERSFDGTLTVVDYKTGKVPREFTDFNNQLTIYAEAIRQLYGEPVQKAYDFFLSFKKTHLLEVTSQQVAITGRAAREAWHEVTKLRETMVFPYQTSALCGWCPFVTQCPAGQAAGYGPRVESAELLAGVDMHKSDNGLNHDESEPLSIQEDMTMTMTKNNEPVRYTEGKKWEPLLSNGKHNLGSYEADNANRVAGLAWRIADTHCTDRVSNAELVALSRVLTHIVGTAAKEAVNASNPISLGASLWTTSYYTFTSWMKDNPIDFNDLEAWSDRAIKSVKRILQFTHKVLADSYEDVDFQIDPDMFGAERWV
jgi:putative RecB family exonuclease